MATGDVTFQVFDVLTDAALGAVYPNSWAFGEVVHGAGELSMNLPIDPRTRDALRVRTNPDKVQVVAFQEDRQGRVLPVWGGVLNYRARTPGTLVLNCKAQEWRSWLYTRLHPTTYYRAADEYTLAQHLLQLAVTGAGTPLIVWQARTSGKTRQLTLQPWTSYGDALDSLGGRDDGFEWTLDLELSPTTGLPRKRFMLWEPGAARTGTRPDLRLVESAPRNSVSIGEVTESATDRRTRVWATGEGQPPAQPLSKDEDPDLLGGSVLLRETVTNWPGVTRVDTLFNHARGERLERSLVRQTLDIDVPVDSPLLTQYRVGDRARVLVQDAWENIDVVGARITARSVNRSGRESVPVATLTVDLSDVSAD